MLRTPVLPDDFNSYGFEKPYKNESNPRVKIRLLGLILLKAGKTYTEIGKILQVKRQTVSE